MPLPVRYKPVKAARLFTRTVSYDAINWNDWNEVSRRFQQQLRWWYVTPIRHLRNRAPHSAFVQTALCCVLIDTLSQYDAGTNSSGSTFKSYVRSKLPHLCVPFPTPIRTWDEKRNRETSAKDFADVLWHGFRCGILHEAHMPLYGRIWGIPTVHQFVPAGFTTYADTGHDCPTIQLHPAKLVDEVEILFREFFADLRNPGNVIFRQNFASKFHSSYGIDIGNEP